MKVFVNPLIHSIYVLYSQKTRLDDYWQERKLLPEESPSMYASEHPLGCPLADTPKGCPLADTPRRVFRCGR